MLQMLHNRWLIPPGTLTLASSMPMAQTALLMRGSANSFWIWIGWTFLRCLNRNHVLSCCWKNLRVSLIIGKVCIQRTYAGEIRHSLLWLFSFNTQHICAVPVGHSNLLYSIKIDICQIPKTPEESAFNLYLVCPTNWLTGICTSIKPARIYQRTRWIL